MTRGPEHELPRRLHLEVTNRCNSLCATCVRTREPEAAMDLSKDTLAALLEELPELESAALQVNGEPLLYPHLLWLIARLGERGVDTELNTNAITLEGGLARSLADSRLARLNVSIDGARSETYTLLRGVDALGRARRNVSAFLALRPAGGPRVVLWVTVSRHSVDELPALVELALELGVDGLYLQRLVHFEYGKATLEDSLHGRLRDEQRARLVEAVEAARRAGLEVRASGEHEPAAMLEAAAPGEEPFRDCRRPFESAVVMANGDVVPCCISTFVAPRAEIVMGNLGRASLREIWSGHAYGAWRDGLRQGEAPRACLGCGVNWSL